MTNDQFQFIGKTAMKYYLNNAINILASLFVMVLGAMQAAQAEEVWLDFSVPEADVILASPTVRTTSEAAPKALTTQPLTWNRELSVASEERKSAPLQTIVPVVDANQNIPRPVALDFGVPKADSTSVIAPLAPEISAQIEATNVNPTPPPVETEVPPPPQPLPQPPKVPTIKTPASKLPSSKPLRLKVTALRRAIIGQESAGRFWLINPDSGALGYGQLLRTNVAPWTKAALGRALTPEEFLASPKLQIKTIDHKLNEYLKRELAYTGGKNEQLAIRRVASRWYSGNPNLWNNTRPQYSNGRRYPSIASYTRSVWKRYLREVG